MQLLEVRTVRPIMAMSHLVQGNSLRKGECGVCSMELLPDLSVLVTGTNRTVLLYPTNVDWVVPLDEYTSHLAPSGDVRVTSEAQPTTPAKSYDWKSIRREKK